MSDRRQMDMDGLREHWAWRPEWVRERPCLYWYLAVGPAGLAEACEPVLAELRRTPWLDVVPPAWWHVTVCDVGFEDELDPSMVDRVGASVAEAVAAAAGGTPPGALHLDCGPYERFASAVALRVGPSAAVGALQQTVRDATELVLGPGRPLVHRHRFRPHLSLGYANRAVTGAELDSLARRLPEVAGQAQVDRLSLVAVTRRDRHYQWSVRREVPLHRVPVPSGAVG
ncbi:2'-5' RNA ligase family protein [Nocardioides sp. NPDC092400]|uniref:2'-5' RNA ligase family protein n=1 Tax=Nocardioides sp. NPDC092400 TaxID=3155196 RepID=UPI003412C386